MINPEELRIGNLVYPMKDNGQGLLIPQTFYPMLVSEIKFEGVECYHTDKPVCSQEKSRLLGYKMIDSIRLTEERLLRFGFEKYEWCDDCAYIPFNGRHMMLSFYNDLWSCTQTRVSKDSNGQKTNGHKDILPKGRLQYIHQLQNLYYALVGKELKLKA